MSARMAGHVTKSLEPIDTREMADEDRQRSGQAVGRQAVVAVDVLPEQRDLADALLDEAAGFVN